jgi:hypothetical protein
MSFRLPVTEDDLWQAVNCGKKNKAPVNNGIPTEFYQLVWPVIKEDMLQVIDMYTSKTLPPIQTRGIIVCVPKFSHPASPEEYRLLTLLNSDIRIFAHVLANRMRPWMRDMIHPSQYGGVGDTILDALAVIRETVAMAEMRNEPACVLSLDFKPSTGWHTVIYTKSCNIVDLAQH